MGLSAPVMAGQGKLALVVGNQAYQNLPRLANPGNDARGMADALRRLGFEVTLLTDVNTEVFNVVVKAFGVQAKSAETVVFYYSGHAFQLDGQNHLLPVAVKPDANGAVDGQTWKLDDVISELQAP
ncbi:MAG: caspase family protein, partial [Pseudorhodobacter sp.]